MTTMQPVRRQRIFPLSLSPIETLMMVDDTPRYPMTFVIQLDFKGHVDLRSFEPALEEALLRHPLLRCLVKPAKRDVPCWVEIDDFMPPIDVASEEVPVRCQSESIDLSRETGLRIWIRSGVNRSKVTMQFHHACTDGIGAYRFIGDLLALYGMRTAQLGDKMPSLHDLDATQLRDRGRKTIDVAASKHRWRMAKHLVRNGLWTALRGGSTLSKPNQRHNGAPTPYPGMKSYTFSRSQCTEIRNAAGQCGGTLNDLLVQEYLCSILAWNQVHRPLRPGRKIRIMMPADLRTGDDYEMPAANMMSYTFIERYAHQLRDKRPNHLLRSIQEETLRIKHLGLGKQFNDTVAIAQMVPGLFGLTLSNPLPMASAVLSNVGDPTRRFTAKLPRDRGRVVSGNLILEGITGVPPMRRGTRATVSVFNYNRQLTLSARCDPFSFSLDDTAAFLATYVQRLATHVSEELVLPVGVKEVKKYVPAPTPSVTTPGDGEPAAA